MSQQTMAHNSDENEDFSRLIKQGTLYVQSVYLKKWREKWIFLKGFIIFVYDQEPVDHKTNDASNIIDLSVYDIQSKDPYQFELFSTENAVAKGSSIKFKAKTNQEIMEWMECIQIQRSKLFSVNDVDNLVISSTAAHGITDDGFSKKDTELSLKLSMETSGNANDIVPDPRALFDLSFPMPSAPDEASFGITNDLIVKDPVNVTNQINAEQSAANVFEMQTLQ